MEKDPVALKETKEVLRVGRRLNDEETWYWAQAKTNELTYLQKGEWLDKGIGRQPHQLGQDGLGKPRGHEDHQFGLPLLEFLAAEHQSKDRDIT